MATFWKKTIPENKEAQFIITKQSAYREQWAEIKVQNLNKKSNDYKLKKYNNETDANSIIKIPSSSEKRAIIFMPYSAGRFVDTDPKPSEIEVLEIEHDYVWKLRCEDEFPDNQSFDDFVVKCTIF